MRHLFGWACIFTMLPIFIICVFVAGKESQAIKGLSTILDEKIPIESVDLAQNSYIFDHEGRLISEITSNQQNRIYVKYENIPEIVKKTYLVSEDQRFFDHIGFDAAGMFRAVLINAKSESVEQGGSTITQQLARNVYLNHEQSYNRKLSELLYSYQLEKTFTKEQIFEYYLNAIYFGNGQYGIGTAAVYYFNKQVHELHLAELIFISAIPNNPTQYDPVKNYKATKERQERLLQSLFEFGAITVEEKEAATKFPIKLFLKNKVDVQPDYVAYVHHELKQLVAEKEGLKDNNKINTRVNEILSQGVIIYTALESDRQNKLVHSLNNHIQSDSIQGAAAVINHQSHQIVALAGGVNYKKFEFNRAFQAYRQPGSSIKPLLDYAPYIDLTGATTKSKINAGRFCSGGYCPKNYSGRNYGMVSLETALKYSYNTAAVRMLNEIGIEKGFSYLAPFHFAKISKQDYQLPAAIGGMMYGISPLELTDAYTTFGNNGMYYENHAIVKITDQTGNTLYEWDNNPVRVWKETTNKQMRSLLAAVVSSGTGKKAAIHKSYVGGKTGTSNDYHDLWFAGLTDQYTGVVWVGKDQPGNIRSIYERGSHLLIWKEMMK